MKYTLFSADALRPPASRPLAAKPIPKAPKRRGLPFETVDLQSDGRRQHVRRGIPPEAAEFVFQMLLGFGGNVAKPLFLLENSDELSGDRQRTLATVIRVAGGRQDGARRGRSPSGF